MCDIWPLPTSQNDTTPPSENNSNEPAIPPVEVKVVGEQTNVDVETSSNLEIK